MKKITIFSFILLSLLTIYQTHASSNYETFQQKATEHRKQIEREGLSYMVGGALGLGTSLGLGISSKEVFPKIGYGLIQTLSSAAIAYGGIQYFTGDDFTTEAEKLRALSNSLSKTINLSTTEKQRLLDEAVQTSLRITKIRRTKTKRIRGTLELITAGSAGLTMVFSENTGSAANIALGFIVLVTTIGGVADLVTATSDTSLDLLHAKVRTEVIPGPALSLVVLRW